MGINNNPIIKKAVILAGGLGMRFLPATKSLPKEMMPIVDKPVLQFIIEEAVESGIEEILVITNSNKDSIENHFDRDFELEARLKKAGKDKEYDMIREIADLANVFYIRQKQPRGLGDAVLCAKSFVGNKPFALLLGDDIIVSEGKLALRQLIEFYENTIQAPVIAVQTVAADEVCHFGIVDPMIPNVNEQKYVKLSGLVEKPSIEIAPSNKGIVGRYILTPEIFDILEKQGQKNGLDGDNINHLSEALIKLMDVRTVYGYEIDGCLYDIEDNITYVKTLIKFACQRDDMRDKVVEYIKKLASNL